MTIQKMKVIRKDGITYERKMPENPQNTFLQVRMSKEEKEMFSVIAKKNGSTISQITKDLILKYIEENK